MPSFWRRRKFSICTHSNKASTPHGIITHKLRSHSTILCTFVSQLSGHLNDMVQVLWAATLSFWRGRKSSLPMLSDNALAPVAPSHTHTPHRAATHAEGLFHPACSGLCCFTFSQAKTLVLSFLVSSLSSLSKRLVSPPLFLSLSVTADCPLPAFLGN
jgi:hypothetical protein